MTVNLLQPNDIGVGPPNLGGKPVKVNDPVKPAAVVNVEREHDERPSLGTSKPGKPNSPKHSKHNKEKESTHENRQAHQVDRLGNKSPEVRHIAVKIR